LDVRAKLGLDETVHPEVLRLQEFKAGSADADTLTPEVRTQVQLKDMGPGDADPPTAVWVSNYSFSRRIGPSATLHNAEQLPYADAAHEGSPVRAAASDRQGREALWSRWRARG